MFELLTGLKPHEGKSPQMIVKFMSRDKRLTLPSDGEILEAQGKPPTSRVKAELLPISLRQLFSACAATTPAERPTAVDAAHRIRESIFNLDDIRHQESIQRHSLPQIMLPSLHARGESTSLNWETAAAIESNNLAPLEFVFIYALEGEGEPGWDSPFHHLR